MKTPNSLRRRGAIREQYPLYLIVCEGDVTERHYLSDLRHLLRVPVRLEFDPGGVPLTLGQKAVERNRAEGFDAVWVLFDIDDHPNVAAAKDQAKANGIQLAISNPCFELWALLHFQDRTAHIERSKLRELLCRHLPGYEKELPIRKLHPHTEAALARATALRTRHQRNGTEGANPSTDVDMLVATLRKAALRR